MRPHCLFSTYGSVHFFAIDSSANEPDGNTADSVQANWLKTELAAAQEPWKIVYMHHPPYSSGSVHGSTADLQWPYAEWGATAVLAGHDHTYERLNIDGLTYFVNGVGGSSLYGQGALVEGSQYFYSEDYGAMLVTADDNSIQFDFYNRSGKLLDHYATVPETLPVALIAGVFLGLVGWDAFLLRGNKLKDLVAGNSPAMPASHGERKRQKWQA
jgi:tartrate-resistant acid phosphatase type 5